MTGVTGNTAVDTENVNTANEKKEEEGELETGVDERENNTEKDAVLFRGRVELNHVFDQKAKVCNTVERQTVRE